MILEEYNRQTKKLNVLGQYNKQEFSNRAFCILAHCDTENKLKQLNDKIDIVKQKYNLENLFEYWKTKVFKKKDWGMRKLLKELPFKLNYETLDKQLLDPSFNQVR